MVFDPEEEKPKFRKCPKCGTRFKKQEDGTYFCNGCLTSWSAEEYEKFCEEGKAPDVGLQPASKNEQEIKEEK